MPAPLRDPCVWGVIDAPRVNAGLLLRLRSDGLAEAEFSLPASPPSFSRLPPPEGTRAHEGLSERGLVLVPQERGQSRVAGIVVDTVPAARPGSGHAEGGPQGAAVAGASERELGCGAPASST